MWSTWTTLFNSTRCSSSVPCSEGFHVWRLCEKQVLKLVSVSVGGNGGELLLSFATRAGHFLITIRYTYAHVCDVAQGTFQQSFSSKLFLHCTFRFHASMPAYVSTDSDAIIYRLNTYILGIGESRSYLIFPIAETRE